MGYRYCPQCGAEYRADVDRCSDCLVELVDDKAGTGSALEGASPAFKSLVPVLVTGRRSEAEVARSFLEAHGVEAQIWSSGLSPWRMEAALTEMTGLANDFNAHRVMVSEQDEEAARDLLEEPADDGQSDDLPRKQRPSKTSPKMLELFRKRWLVLTFAIVLLLLVILFGPPSY